MEPIGSISGLASGIQWRDMVDQIMQMETTRRLKPLQNQVSEQQKKFDAWGAYSNLAAKLRDALAGLRDGTAFGAFNVDVGNSAATNRALLTASASGSAAPGSYKVEVLELARANKLSGDIVASATTALGLSGEFAVNGKRVDVAAGDTLSSIRDKINALNAGTSPSGVSATILSTGAGAHRLVLTSEVSGATGIELVDGTSGVLSSLGVVDAAKTLNLSSSGGAQTHHLSAATAAIATMMGVSFPPPSTITVGGQTISVDLSVDSLTSIAAKIQALGIRADVVSEKVGANTTYQLVTDGAIGASTADGQRTLEVLGFVKNTRSSVAQVVQSENQFTDAASAVAGSGTLLTELRANGGALGIAVGDSIVMQGTRGDGSVVNLSVTVGANDTLQTVLDRLNDASGGYGAGTRTAVASLSNGRIVLTDGQGGDSQLALSLSVAKAGGAGATSLGRMSTVTVGRAREVVSGADAKVRVDGVVLSRPTNSIGDAIAGVTLNLQAAEPGSTVTLSIARDTDAITNAVNDVAFAYNEMLKFVSTNTAPGKPLAGNTVLRSSMQALTRELLATTTGVSGAYTRPGLVGLALQKDGTLALDSAVFKSALATNFADVVRLFGTSGTSTTDGLTYEASNEKTRSGSYAVNITAPATTASVAGSGFGGIYVDDGSADTMTISDAVSGATGSIALADGDTSDTIIDKLNALFAAKKMALSASKNGTEIAIAGTSYGSAATFTIAYAGGGTDASAQLGLAAGTYAGTDVAGTIDGIAAKGVGRVLTADAGTPAEGLSIRYTGSATGAVGSLGFVLGVAGALSRAADVIARAGDGTSATQREVAERAITSLNRRADTVQENLDRRRESLLRQFMAMESALSRIQSQGNSLSSMLLALQPRRD